MPTSKSEWVVIQRHRRGARVAEIREALQMNGEEFAETLRRQLAAIGFEGRYDKAKISRIESGVRDLSNEELAVIAHLDPYKRSVLWLVFGEAAYMDMAAHYQQAQRRAAREATHDPDGNGHPKPRRRRPS